MRIESSSRSDLFLDRAFLNSRRASKWSRYPADVIASWIAEMDFMPAPAVHGAIEAIVARADYGYPLRRVMPAESMVAEAFASRMEEQFGWRIDADCVQPVTDLLQATVAVILAFSEPGEGVAVHTPCFPPFREAIEEAGRRIVEIPMIDDGSRFVPDMDALRAAPDDTRVLILCNPHNPTGRVLTRTELQEIGAVVQSRGMVVFSDEIHADFVFDGRRHLPFASLDPSLASSTVTANSPSKSFGIAGLRCGVIHFGSRGLLQRFRQRVPRLLLGKPSVVAIDATVAAWTEGHRWLAQVQRHVERMRDLTIETIRGEMPGLSVYKPEATFLAWVDCSAKGWADPAGKAFLERGRLAFSAGETFCARHPAFVRVNFATSPDILGEMLARMRRVTNADASDP